MKKRINNDCSIMPKIVCLIPFFTTYEKTLLILILILSHIFLFDEEYVDTKTICASFASSIWRHQSRNFEK